MSVSTLQKQARQHTSDGEYRKAAVCLQKALRQVNGTRPACKRERLCLQNELGIVCKYLGRFDKAEKYYRLALRQAADCFQGRERDFFLATLYHNLGGVEHARRRFRSGESYSRKALQHRRKAAEAGSLAVASDMAALAALLDAQQSFAEAEALYVKALKTYRREYGTNHVEIAVVLNNLAALYQATGREKRAQAHYSEALRMKRKVLGPTHPDVGVTLNNLGMLSLKGSREKEAAKYFRKAISILMRSLGSTHPNTRAVQHNLQRIRRTVS